MRKIFPVVFVVVALFAPTLFAKPRKTKQNTADQKKEKTQICLEFAEVNRDAVMLVIFSNMKNPEKFKFELNPRTRHYEVRGRFLASEGDRMVLNSFLENFIVPSDTLIEPLFKWNEDAEKNDEDPCAQRGFERPES